MTQQIIFRILVTIAFLGITFIMFIHGYNKELNDEEYNYEDWWLYILYVISGIIFMGLLTN